MRCFMSTVLFYVIYIEGSAHVFQYCAGGAGHRERLARAVDYMSRFWVEKGAWKHREKHVVLFLRNRLFSPGP